MPPELVSLRENMDAMSDTADKQRFVNDWIDAFLRMMNEGQPQTEADTDAAETTETQSEDAVDTRAVGRVRTATAGEGERGGTGLPDQRGTAEPGETPEGTGGSRVPDAQGEVRGDAARTAPGVETDIPTDNRDGDVVSEGYRLQGETEAAAFNIKRATDAVLQTLSENPTETDIKDAVNNFFYADGNEANNDIFGVTEDTFDRRLPIRTLVGSSAAD